MGKVVENDGKVYSLYIEYIIKGTCGKGNKGMRVRKVAGKRVPLLYIDIV